MYQLVDQITLGKYYDKLSTYGQHYFNEIHAYFFLPVIATFNRTMFFEK